MTNLSKPKLVIVISILSFKGITHAYILKVSITRNKKRIPLLNWLIIVYPQDQHLNIVY